MGEPNDGWREKTNDNKWGGTRGWMKKKRMKINDLNEKGDWRKNEILNAVNENG